MWLSSIDAHWCPCSYLVRQLVSQTQQMTFQMVICDTPIILDIALWEGRRPESETLSSRITGLILVSMIAILVWDSNQVTPGYRRRSTNTYQLSRRRPEASLSKPHMVNLWMLEDFWYPSQWPWVKVPKLLKPDIFYLVPTKNWEPLESLVVYPSCHAFHLIKFWRNSVKNVFWRKFQMCFSPIEHSVSHISGMLGPVDMKQKGNESTGCYAS